MTDVAGDEIAEFYRLHPYPPAVESLDGEVDRAGDEDRRRLEHARMWPSLPYREDHSILIAGCGTSQAVRYAMRYPKSTVVGIDVSTTSIDATVRLAVHHEVTNIEVHQLRIEDVGSLARTFDHVVCTGVLHHLADPAAALRELRNVVTPSGAMQLMVYATYGRTGVYMMQEYCRRLGLTTAGGDLTDLIATLREMPTGHPMSHVLRETADFRDDDAIADALFNPRDRSYTVPELLELVEASGLRLGRWVRQAPYRPHCGAMSETPHAARIASMAEPDQFAAMELFRGTMPRHSVVLHRDDSPLPVSPVRWDSDAWRSFVPIRPPTVVMVEERLPPSVAGVLINQAHVDRDLVFFLDSDERPVYESIDGETAIGDIVGATPGLFERLWWHDLVMVDTSRHGAGPLE